MAFNSKKAALGRSAINNPKAVRHASLDFKPPRHFRIFRNTLIGSVAVAMTAVLYTIYWFVIATSLKDAVTSWIEARAAQGIVASYSQIEISGFPTKFKVVLTDPKLQTSDLIASNQHNLGGEKWRWQGARAIAEMKPWNFSKFSVDLAGGHDVSFVNRGGAYQFSGTAQKFIMDADIHADGWPEKMRLDVNDFTMTEAKSKAIVAVKSAVVLSHRLLPGDQGRTGAAKTPSYTLKAKFKGVHLPKFLNLPLGQNIQKLTTELTVFGDLGLSTDVHNLARWRDAGGVIEIDLLEATYGSLKTHATGSIALDKNLQPMAALLAKSQGFFGAINALKKAGYIRSGDAAMAKVVLGVLSRRTGNGPRSISLPLTLQDGQLSAGPVSLMAVPAIDWGEDPPPPVILN